MPYFHPKNFNGVTYRLDHLDPITYPITLDQNGLLQLDVAVRYRSHCFTENFDNVAHQDEHRYTFQGETRAFDLVRYQCSQQLPVVMAGLFRSTIYQSDRNLTYVAQIALNPAPGVQPYSVFFSLLPVQVHADQAPKLDLLVRSAYLAPLKNRGAQKWRFASLAGQIAGIWQKPPKPPKPAGKRKGP